MKTAGRNNGREEASRREDERRAAMAGGRKEKRTNTPEARFSREERRESISMTAAGRGEGSASLERRRQLKGRKRQPGILPARRSDNEDIAKI